MNFKTPGVYIQEVEVAPAALLRLSIAGFVGQAERGPLNYPQPLSSWAQFRDIFGDFIGFGYLPYAVFGFFLNGGERCYGVRVAHETATKATIDLVDKKALPTIRVTAINEGTWANALVVTAEEQSTRFKLAFRYQPSGTLVREEVFDNLSMNETDERYFVRIINGEPEEADYLKRIQNGNSILVRVEDLCQGRADTCDGPQTIETNLEEGADGSHQIDTRYYTGYDENEAYFHPHPPGANAEKVQEIEEKLFGLASLEAVSDIGSIAIPDLIIPDFFERIPNVQIPQAGIVFAMVPQTVLTLKNLKAGQRDMLRHCEKMGDRFAILDSPRGSKTGKGTNRIEDWPGLFQQAPNTKYGALYYPWIKEKRSDFGGRDLFIPPSGHLAGIYARSERERSVGKAPANEILQGVVELEFLVSNTEQDILNPRGVNCLRSFPGRGLRVWGARTLSSDSQWRYVNVRRICLVIIKTILVNLQWTVFEPNDQQLRDKIVATLTLFFRDLLQSATLAGTRPEEAFFVKCDDETNPPEVVERGEVVTRIGFAPVQPAEFILVTIRRTAESLSAREQTF